MRVATCRCGRLRAECADDPVRVSVCHCLECQRRTGSAFSAQARFAAASVSVSGKFRMFTRKADSGSTLSYQFCPNCGSTIAYQIDSFPDVVAVPIGAFEEAELPDPVYSVYERRKWPWASIVGGEVEHHD